MPTDPQRYMANQYLKAHIHRQFGCGNFAEPCDFKIENFLSLQIIITSGSNKYHILLSIVRSFLLENDAEILPAHYTWKVTEKGFKMAFIMNKLAMINSSTIILEKKMFQ